MPDMLNRVEFAEGEEQRLTVYMVDSDTGSWASCHIGPVRQEAALEGRQHVPRELFTELEVTFRRWEHNGRPPGGTCFGLTVTAEHQHVWLDDETNGINTSV